MGIFYIIIITAVLTCLISVYLTYTIMKINNQQSFIKGYIAGLNESKIYKIHPELYNEKELWKK